MQKILNKKLANEEFDKRVYDSPNFKKYYVKAYKREIDLLLSGLFRERKSHKKRVPKCSLINLNVNRRKTHNKKEDYVNIIKYIKQQSILNELIESKSFTINYFDIAQNLNLLAKPVKRNSNKSNNYKGLK